MTEQFERGSDEYKTWATFTTVIDTLAAVMAAIRGNAQYGIPAQVLAVSGVIASGIASIVKIQNTDLSNANASKIGSSSTNSVDSVSKMASPISSTVQAVNAYGGTNSVASGAAASTAIINSDSMAMAMVKALNSMPAPVVSVVDINNGQNRVKVLDNITSIKK